MRWLRYCSKKTICAYCASLWRNDFEAKLLFITWLSSDFVKHVLASQRFRDSLGRVLGQGVFSIGAGDLEDAIVQHYDA